MIEQVQEILEQLGVQYALIGGMALAARGYARFTVDFDLLTTDKRVLQEAVWSELRARGAQLDVRKADHDDPLAGVVRIGSKPQQVDVVVGRWKWEQRVIERAQRVEIGGRSMPVPLASDLILLKLAAGGPIDQQDIMALLSVGPREELVAEVNGKIADLPQDAAALWKRIVDETA